MTTERARELLPVMQAYADGKRVQHKIPGYVWHDDDGPTWAEGVEYRIRPEYEDVKRHNLLALLCPFYTSDSDDGYTRVVKAVINRMVRDREKVIAILQDTPKS